MERQVAWAAGKPGSEDPLLSFQSDTEAYYGRLGKARDFSRRAVDSAVRNDSKETAALWQVNAALREAEFGNTAAAKQGVAAALALAPGRDVRLFAALTLARVGESARAKAIAEELEKNYPSDTIAEGLLATHDSRGNGTECQQSHPGCDESRSGCAVRTGQSAPIAEWEPCIPSTFAAKHS